MKRPGPHPAWVSQATGHAEPVDTLVDLFVWAADLGLDPHQLIEQRSDAGMMRSSRVAVRGVQRAFVLRAPRRPDRKGRVAAKEPRPCLAKHEL
jgi:hypothetical protein